MTAVLSPTNPFSTRDRMADDNDFSYSSSTDWRAKYEEVAEMLAETRAELDDFHHASKELEAELENELARTEKAQQDLKVKVEKAEAERDEWKAKFVSLQTTHNTTTASLQRELDKLRQEHQQLKVQYRDLEMGNDDLERNERAVTSSLADVEAKYTKALEEKILLEHELLDKASVEEQCQRLKDELRDANVEISVLKDQISALQQAQQQSPLLATRSEADVITLTSSIPSSSEDLLSTQPPLELRLSDLTPNSEPESPILTTPRAASSNSSLHDDTVRIAPPNPKPTQISRSTTLPTLSPALRPSRPAVTATRPLTAHLSSGIAAAVPPTARNKGVQMVSEMRARVKNLEQKIHTRVPRLRMASITGRVASQTQTDTPPIPSLPLDKPIPENSPFYTSPNLGSTSKRADDSTGWVLIMEDSPSPPRKQDRERRRVTSPSRRFVSASAARNTPYRGTSRIGSLNHSTMTTRRPASRQSGESLSTTTTASSISRPTTPTMLPLASPTLYSIPQNGTGSKRSTGPFQPPKRTSLGASTAMPPPSDTTPGSSRIRPATVSSRSQSTTPSSTSSTRSKTESENAMPRLPSIYSNLTLRASSRVPPSSTSTLSQSRIGKPNTVRSGRRSVGERKHEGNFLDSSPSTFKAEGRPRAGSVADSRY